MKNLTIAAALAALLAATPALADPAASRHAVAGEKLDSGLGTFVFGQKLDSGLGEVAPYRTVVAGQKLDSGLGDLPHYRHWADKTGARPMQADLVAKVSAAR